MKTILYTWFAVLLFGMAAVSCGDDDTKNNDTTGITGSSWKASETVGADRTTKKYTFKASANWVAQSDKPEWCKILTSSGDKGSDRQLNITVEANETGSTRSANITVQVSGYARAAQFAITQLGSSSGGTGADTELNKQVDKILEYYYLWNGEYRQMSRDLSLDYISSSDNFLKRTLLEMTTNDLDKKRQSNGSYSVYSYLLRTPLTKAVAGTTRGVSHGVVKEKEYGFGIAGLMGVRFVTATTNLRENTGWSSRRSTRTPRHRKQGSGGARSSPSTTARPARARSTNITGTTTAAWPRSKKRRRRPARNTTRRPKNSSTNSITATIMASTCGIMR